MNLQHALENSDYELATHIAKDLNNDEIIDALNNTATLQNLHASWIAIDFWQFLEERNILSLDALKNMGEEEDEDVNFDSIDIECLINSTAEKKTLRVDYKKPFLLL